MFNHDMTKSKWQRHRFHPVLPLGKDNRLVTGSPEHIELSRQAAADGMVLLKNEGNLLPLGKGTRVALFGKGSADYVKGGGGSSSTTCAYVRDLCQAMEIKAGDGKLIVYSPLHEFYRENVAAQRAEGKKPGYTVEPELPAALLDDAAANSDIAIISICRFSSESWDRDLGEHDGDFNLSLEEEKLVADVTARFDRVVLVLNVGGLVNTSWFKDNPAIPAVLMAWQGGMEGALAQADILCGDVCPSGRLVDSFAADLYDYPASENFNESTEYVHYTDDIFVGYRYFETIPGAAEKVNYPFGFGLSYTTFDWQCLHTAADETSVSVRVRVTNTGNVAGRQVIQLYSSPQGCRMDMAAIELRAFAKTGTLTPGASQELELTFATDELAAYDETLAAYVLQAGEYTIRVGTDIRTLTDVCTYTQAQEKTVCQLVNRCVPRKLPKRMKADGSYELLEMSEYDPLPDTSDWPEKAVKDMEHILPNLGGVFVAEGRPYFDAVAEGELSLDDFMAQLTDEEVLTLLGGTWSRGPSATRGIGGLESGDIPAIMTSDGPTGLRFRPNRGVNTTAFPVGTALGCTWDTGLLERIGVAMGLETKENNVGMLLAPAINIHRSPMCGRNFEYFSEDPLVSGKMGAAVTRGIQSTGISACVKHLCCNNKEFKRSWSDSRVSERAMREIYLKGFEVVVKEADVWAIMTGYNIVNGHYCSENRDLLTGIVREEWNFNGLIVTDWWNQAEHYREVLAGNNLRMPLGSPRRLQRAMEEGLITREDLVRNVRYILEFILRMA